MTNLNEVSVFVRDVAERGVKTAAQAAVLQVAAQGGSDALHSSAFNLNWMALAGFALGGFVLSVLTSLASQPVGNGSTGSLLSSVAAVPSFASASVADVVASTVATAVADPATSGLFSASFVAPRVVAPAPVPAVAAPVVDPAPIAAAAIAPTVVNVAAPALPTIAPAVQ